MMNKKGLMDIDMVYIAAFIILTFLSSLCRSDNQLTQTKPLLPKDTLISEGGDFALGFFSPTNSSKKLYIGIWYHHIAERTVVWVANRDNPIKTPSAKLAITGNSELVLSDSQGHTLWTATGKTGGGGAGASAVLLSSGNFVLRSPNGTELWQSFDHPTDNVLPTMRVLLSYKAQPATHLFAWKGPNDPSTGDFSLGMDPTSNLQLFIWNGALPYFRFPVVNGNPVSGGMQQINGVDVILYQTTINTADKSYYMYTVSPGSPYIRISLDYTGKGRLLAWNSTTSSWAVIVEVPNSCGLYAYCGPFGYCDRTEAIPTCRCLDGFELLDSLNFSRGCQRREALKCGKEDYFMAMPNMKLPDKFLHIRDRSFEQCAAECTRNCSCMAYAYANLTNGDTMGDTSRCLVWAGDLIDMEKQIFEEVLYIRLGKSPGTCIHNTSSFFPQK